jgi:YD repeat-containing protein
MFFGPKHTGRHHTHNTKNLVTASKLLGHGEVETEIPSTGRVYFNSGLLKKFTDEAGFVHEYVRDHLGRVTSEKAPAISESSGDYPASGTVEVLSRSYTVFGAVKDQEVISGLTGVVTKTVNDFDDGGRLSKQTVNGVETHYVRDALGRVTESWTGPEADLPAAITAGVVSRSTYNDVGQVLTRCRVTSAGETEKWTYEYDEAGRQEKVTDPLNNSTQTVYDDLGRVKQVIDPLGRYTENAYYPSGKLQATRDKNGRWSYFEYDARGRLTRKTDSGGNAVNYEYFENVNIAGELYHAQTVITDPDMGQIRRMSNRRHWGQSYIKKPAQLRRKFIDCFVSKYFRFKNQ